MTASLYERLGGEPALLAVAAVFYDKVTIDPRVRHFFAGLDLAQQVRKQVSFLARAFGGGPQAYDRRLPCEALAKLVRERGMGLAHFDVVAELLRETLVELEVDEALIDEVMVKVQATRDEVPAG